MPSLLTDELLNQLREFYCECMNNEVGVRLLAVNEILLAVSSSSVLSLL